MADSRCVRLFPVDPLGSRNAGSAVVTGDIRLPWPRRGIAARTDCSIPDSGLRMAFWLCELVQQLKEKTRLRPGEELNHGR